MEMTMENKTCRASLFLLVQLILLLLILDFVIIFQGINSCFHYIIKAPLHILFCTVRKMWVAIETPNPRSEAESSSSSSCSLSENVEGDQDNETETLMTIEEVKMAMEKATLQLNSSGNNIATLFEEEELSVEEVKEAFEIFDENTDGFIDARELRNVLSTLNLSQASLAECQNMINAFDEDGDGRIGFAEFAKLLDSSFSF